MTSAPGVSFRIFSAIIARSEAVALASRRAYSLIFLRRCRRRFSSFFRSQIDTFQVPGIFRIHAR